MSGISTDFIYLLDFNKLSFSDGIAIPQKIFIFTYFMRFKLFFFSKVMKAN